MPEIRVLMNAMYSYWHYSNFAAHNLIQQITYTTFTLQKWVKPWWTEPCWLCCTNHAGLVWPQRRFDRKLKFLACLNLIYCHGCHIRLPLSNNCRGTWNKNVVKRCRIIQETILKHKKKRYTSGDKLSLLYMAHVIV